jgi:SPP1 gp7 family putative phage head morphogenesis protein
MSAYKEFEKIIFSFTVEAGELGGQEAVDRVEYGHAFHFTDKDAIKALKENAAQLSKSSLERLKGNLDETIIAGVKDGKPIREITKDVHAIFDDMKGYEAERIARTEVARGVSEGALIGYDSMGVEIVEFYANAGACPVCSGYHGELMTLGEATGNIPVHPNCYCFWLPRPDIENKNVKGWRSVGEIDDGLLKGLGAEHAFSRVSMSPEALKKIQTHGTGHLEDYERVRLAVETADQGFTTKTRINLVNQIREDKWELIPIKNTDDYGLIALTGHELNGRTLQQKLRGAVKDYGF